MEKTAIQIMEQLMQFQYEAYFVGGYVRDFLLGKTGKDVDIATSATPQQVMAIFKHTIPTGLKHGTVTVLIDGHPIEVTTFRQEAEYEKHRRPKGVHFVLDLETDLRRRDFTMNAMAMDVSGVIIDPFHGREDLKLKVVRCVGNPMERFQEDALRMLRCIRFAANYDFEIDENTWQGLLLNRALLKHIAMERVRVELDSMIAGSHPFRAMNMLLQSELLSYTKATLQLPIKEWTPQQIPVVWSRLHELPEPLLRWCMLFKGMKIDSECTGQVLRKLSFSGKNIRSIVAILKLDEWLEEQIKLNNVQLSDQPFYSSLESLPVENLSRIWKSAALFFGKETVQHWQQIIRLEPINLNQNFAHFLAEGSAWISEMSVDVLADLDITGNDLITFINLPPGPWVSNILQRLLLDAAFGNVRNQKNHLLQRAEIYRKELIKHE